MSDRTNLGDEMKGIERRHRRQLDSENKYVIIRVDGRAFHTYLRYAVKPFDVAVTNAMRETARELCMEIQGTVLAYTQSDEISLLIKDVRDTGTEPWMGGVESKMLSLSAARASVAFAYYHDAPRTLGPGRLPVFDSRLFTIRDPETVRRYFEWRRIDATRNSISMAAQANFSHRSLQGLKAGQMLRRLREEAGVDWNDYPREARHGTWVTYERRPSTVTYVDKRDGKERTTEVDRGFWEFSPGDEMPRALAKLPEVNT